MLRKRGELLCDTLASWFFSSASLSPDHLLWTVLVVLLLEREEIFAATETVSKILSVKITNQMLCSTSQGAGRSGRHSRASVTLIDVPLHWRKHVQWGRSVPLLILGSENQLSGWRTLYLNCGLYDRGPGRFDYKLKRVNGGLFSHNLSPTPIPSYTHNHIYTDVLLRCTTSKRSY